METVRASAAMLAKRGARPLDRRPSMSSTTFAPQLAHHTRSGPPQAPGGRSRPLVRAAADRGAFWLGAGYPGRDDSTYAPGEAVVEANTEARTRNAWTVASMIKTRRTDPDAASVSGS